MADACALPSARHLAPVDSSGPAGAPLLEIDRLAIEFSGTRGRVRAVDGVSLTVGAGETVALVGESGCGKSVTALSVLGLLPARTARRVAGSIRFDGADLSALAPGALRRVRGGAISMVFQEPMTSLNPVLTVGEQIIETVRAHENVSVAEARQRALQMLDRVQIPDAARRLRQYPHELSGGMRQRVMIAIALACGPRLLIADEPTTALDVTIQAQILQILRELARDSAMATLLITHDLGVVAEMARRVCVMYAGRVVESGPTEQVLRAPRHPYTVGLLGARPRLGTAAPPGPGRVRLAEIPGTVPMLAGPQQDCAFAERCPRAAAACREAPPPLRAEAAGNRSVACWHPVDGPPGVAVAASDAKASDAAGGPLLAQLREAQ
jgi:peptide/nickel transport system ATP-binding protein